MKSRSLIAATLVFGGAMLFTACGEGADKDAKPLDVQELTKNQPETHGAEIKEGDIKDRASLDRAFYAVKEHQAHGVLIGNAPAEWRRLKHRTCSARNRLEYSLAPARAIHPR